MDIHFNLNIHELIDENKTYWIQKIAERPVSLADLIFEFSVCKPCNTSPPRRGGGEMEARPGTEKRCSHNLQNGPVKTWTAVFVTIHISVRHGDQLL